MMFAPIPIRWLLYLFLTLGAVFPPTASSAAVAEPLSLGPAEFSYLGGHMEVLKDPSRNIDFKAAHEAYAQGEFIPLPGTLNAGYGRSAYWIHFTIQR